MKCTQLKYTQGRVTDLEGQVHLFNQPRPQAQGIVASNGLLHQDIMALLERR